MGGKRGAVGEVVSRNRGVGRPSWLGWWGVTTATAGRGGGASGECRGLQGAGGRGGLWGRKGGAMRAAGVFLQVLGRQGPLNVGGGKSGHMCLLSYKVRVGRGFIRCDGR